ncbi:MAG: hypothetical protein ACK559_27810, partial [bacterium]
VRSVGNLVSTTLGFLGIVDDHLVIKSKYNFWDHHLNSDHYDNMFINEHQRSIKNRIFTEL